MAQRQHGHRQAWQTALRAGEYLCHLGHHISQQKNHHQHGHASHDGGIQRRTPQFGPHVVLCLQIAGELLQHLRQTPALLARSNHRQIAFVEFTRMHGHGLGQGSSGIHFSAQLFDQFALLGAVRLLAQCAECAFQRQTRCHQARQLLGPDHQGRVVEHA